MTLADDGNYREPRFFTSWKHAYLVEDHILSKMLKDITGQDKIPFGNAAIYTAETSIASEMCEELWTLRRYLFVPR